MRIENSPENALIAGIIFLWVALSPFVAIVPAVIAHKKGYNAFAWWLYGLFLLPIAFIHSLIKSPNEAVLERKKIVSGEMRKCPFCAELIKAEAKVCRYCGKDI